VQPNCPVCDDLGCEFCPRVDATVIPLVDAVALTRTSIDIVHADQMLTLARVRVKQVPLWKPLAKLRAYRDMRARAVVYERINRGYSKLWMALYGREL
jgi:hypothetical protein